MKKTGGKELRAKAIVAMGKNREIGCNGDLPWHLPEDLTHFKTITMGKTVIMGRKTWESLPKKPLLGRHNIVITRNEKYNAEGAELSSSMENSLSSCSEEPFIIGGYQIYKESLPYCHEIYITEVDEDVPEADVFFPELDLKEWKKSEIGEWEESKKGIKYRFVKYIRK